MRHGNAGRRFNRTQSHRKAMLANLAISLVEHEQIVTTLLRNVLFAAYYAALSWRMPNEPDCVVLNWRPDIATLMQVQTVRENSPCRVYYPGRDFTGPELRYLHEFFPKAHFISFDWIAP